MRILMIHGRAQGGKDPDKLKAIWIKTLEKGFQKANQHFPQNVIVDFPFYADRLDHFAAQSSLPTPDDVIAKGSGQDKEFEEFMKSALTEIKLRGKISDNEVAAKMDMQATSKEKGPQNWWWVRAIARAVDSYLTDVSEFTIEEFLKDVYLYLNKPAIASEINRIIEMKLTTEPTLVIGHSLGSVVGYRVLNANREKMDLKKYITVGSPLGITAISGKLGIPENPCGRDGWYNAFDVRDIVALNPLDSDYFPADPEIINYDRVDNQTENRHGIVGYLNDANVARQIAAALV